VNLVLKLNVRANFSRAAHRPVHFHVATILVIGSLRQGACGGFCGTTYEIVLAPSFEGSTYSPRSSEAINLAVSSACSVVPGYGFRPRRVIPIISYYNPSSLNPGCASGRRPSGQ
jgi:hypothetical protein